MKKLLMLTAAGFMLQATPALAADHDGHKDKAEMFKAADANGDGAISKSEYLDHVQKKAAEKFDKKDANGDGSISMDESKAYHKEKRENMKEKMKEKRCEWKDKMKEKKEEAATE